MNSNLSQITARFIWTMTLYGAIPYPGNFQVGFIQQEFNMLVRFDRHSLLLYQGEVSNRIIVQM